MGVVDGQASETAAASAEAQPPHDRLVGKGMLVLFVSLIGCFTVWGIAQDMTTPMVAGFQQIFEMSTFQASLVQLAYFSGVTGRNSAVAGGAGSEAIVRLAKRLQNGDPPDVWQTFSGQAVQGYARRGDIRSLATLADKSRLKSRMNPAIYSSLLRDGAPYAVPTGAHRGNVLFFNPSVLKKAGVQEPTTATTPRSCSASEAGQEGGQHPAVPGRQGPVHPCRAVREHPARECGQGRLEGHQGRQLQLAWGEGQVGAEDLRRNARPGRPQG